MTDMSLPTLLYLLTMIGLVLVLLRMMIVVIIRRKFGMWTTINHYQKRRR